MYKEFVDTIKKFYGVLEECMMKLSSAYLITIFRLFHSLRLIYVLYIYPCKEFT